MGAAFTCNAMLICFQPSASRTISTSPQNPSDKSLGYFHFVRSADDMHYFYRKAGLTLARLLFAAIVVSGLALVVTAQPKIIIEHNTGAAATAKFKFKNVPSPARDDAAAKAHLMIVDAEPDSNSADLSALTDGLLPDSEDQPRKNFFLVAGSGGGRLRMDLNSVIEVAQVNSFSLHSNSRAPQVYRLWASDGTSRNFNAEPKANVDPAACGWRLIATVDTRTEGPDGGKYGVSITGAGGSVGRFRYLLFDLYVTEVADNFGNTFYSEIDVVTK